MHKKRILVIEDDPTIQKSLAYLLKAEGFDVATANNGVEGFDRLDAGFDPALILLDLMMPVMDGAEFVTKLRRRTQNPDMPILLLSGNGQAVAKTEELGVTECVTKPILIEDLLKKIQRYC